MSALSRQILFVSYVGHSRGLVPLAGFVRPAKAALVSIFTALSSTVAARLELGTVEVKSDVVAPSPVARPRQAPFEWPFPTVTNSALSLNHQSHLQGSLSL